MDKVARLLELARKRQESRWHAAELGHTPSLPTNRNLVELLREHFQVALEQVYGTNLFPFIKVGNLSASISAKDFGRAVREFALAQIDIVQPQLVVCLGLNTFNSLRVVLGQSRLRNLAEAIDEPFSYGSTRIWCQSHTGQLGRNNRNRGGVDRVSQDWARMGADIERASAR